MKRAPILFITYFRLVPTGQIGIFKRCVRLFPHLLERFEVHLVNYGPLPATDGELRPLLDDLHIHELPERSLGDELQDLCRRIQPVAVVFGETPVRGNMRLSHRVAKRCGLWQIALENLYRWPRLEGVIRQISTIDRWMFLGLDADGELGRSGDNYEVVPPLVRLAEAPERGRDRICIIGYDKHTLVSGIELIGFLPADLRVDVFAVPAWKQLLEDKLAKIDRGSVRVLYLPQDSVIYGSMARAHVVFGKAGFQQVVEAVLLGARVVCCQAGGGLEAYLVPRHVLDHVAFFDADDEISKLSDLVRSWIAAAPVQNWAALSRQWPDTTPFAAQRLAGLIDQAPGS